MSHYHVETEIAKKLAAKKYLIKYIDTPGVEAPYMLDERSLVSALQDKNVMSVREVVEEYLGMGQVKNHVGPNLKKADMEAHRFMAPHRLSSLKDALSMVEAGLRKNPKDSSLLDQRRTLMKEIMKYESYYERERALEQGAP